MEGRRRSIWYSSGGRMILARKLMMAATVPPRGQQIYGSPGTFSFVVPVGVISICCACVGPGGSAFTYIGSSTILDASGGGGAIAWTNNIPVTPGETLTVVIGAGGSENRTELRRGSTVLVAAAAGRNGGSNSPGAGGAWADCVGSNRDEGYAGDDPARNAEPHGGACGRWGGFAIPSAFEWRGGAGLSFTTTLWLRNNPPTSAGTRRNGQQYGGGACKRVSSAPGDGAGTPAGGGAIIIWGPGRAFSAASQSY